MAALENNAYLGWTSDCTEMNYRNAQVMLPIVA